MIKIISQDSESLYIRTLLSLYKLKRNCTSTYELFKETPAILSLSSEKEIVPINFSGKRFCTSFDYSKYIKNGEELARMEFDYYEEKLVRTKKIEDIVNYLKLNVDSKRALVNLWGDNHRDTKMEAPCLIYLNFTERDGTLHLSCHQRASDAYKMLLLDIDIARSIQVYVAKKTGNKVGVCRLFIDSLHFYNKDKKEIKILFERYKHKAATI